MDVRLTNVYIADARLVAEGLAQPEDAMAVFVGRAGKGRVAPFVVRPSYTGAGGWYREAKAVLAALPARSYTANPARGVAPELPGVEAPRRAPRAERPRARGWRSVPPSHPASGPSASPPAGPGRR